MSPNLATVSQNCSLPEACFGLRFRVPGIELKNLAWPSLQSLAVKKKKKIVQILGGEKLLKFGEKWAVKNF